MIGDESLVKTRTNTCLSYASAIPSYSVATRYAFQYIRIYSKLTRYTRYAFLQGNCLMSDVKILLPKGVSIVLRNHTNQQSAQKYHLCLKDG